jgi:hypothetical protein
VRRENTRAGGVGQARAIRRERQRGVVVGKFERLCACSVGPQVAEANVCLAGRRSRLERDRPLAD